MRLPKTKEHWLCGSSLFEIASGTGSERDYSLRKNVAAALRPGDEIQLPNWHKYTGANFTRCRPLTLFVQTLGQSGRGMSNLEEKRLQGEFLKSVLDGQGGEIYGGWTR